MRPEDAEEYTQALGQVVAGSWRQVALGKRLGVPQALGISTEDWVEHRLGGYIRMSIPERREAVKELTAPVEDGGAGMSTREAAEVLGVNQSTVVRDACASDEPSGDVHPEPQTDAYASGEPEQAIPEVRAVSSVPATEPEEEMLLTGDLDISDIPSGKPPMEYKALSAIRKLSQFRQFDPGEVAAECESNAIDIELDELRRIGSFIDAVADALQSRLERPALALVSR